MNTTDTKPRMTVRMTVREIALMREIVKWRKANRIDYLPDHSRYLTAGGRTVAWTTLDISWDKPMVGVSPAYYASAGSPGMPYEWHCVHSFTEAVDLLAALGYLPARFSTAYLAGYRAGCAVGSDAASLAEAEALAPLPEDS